MPRSDPARSDYCATRHLLRNLREPRQLLRNPLAQDAFVDRSFEDALGSLVDRVNRALRTIETEQPQGRRWRGARWVAILMRVDIEGHRPDRVANDLGVSVRQFHRERRLAHRSFLEAYRNAAAASPAAVDSDFASRMLQRAASLADSGEASSACAILDDIARNGAGLAVRSEALLLLADVNAGMHRLDRARIYHADARSLLAGVPEDRRTRLLDTGDAIALRLLWFEQGPAAVRRRAEDARARIAGRNANAPRTTLVRAAAALRNGEAPYAAALLQRAAADRTAADEPEVAVDILTLQAELADFTAENPMLSEELFARAIAVAGANGLGGRELYAAHQLHLTRWMHSRDASDRSAYRDLVDRVDRSLPPRLRSYLAFSAADVELAIGHPQRALRAARAAGAVSTNTYESFSARGLAAGALLRLGRTAEAGAQAALAAQAARAANHPRIVSLAQRISAQAHLAQGDRPAARTAIEEAIECARHFSSAHVLAQSQAILGMIAGHGRTIVTI